MNAVDFGENDKNDRLEFLKYARENGCPWDEWTYDSETDEETSDSDSDSDSGGDW